MAETENAIPYDVPGVALSHAGDERSFDALLQKYGLTDNAALQQLAVSSAAPAGLPVSAGVHTQQ